MFARASTLRPALVLFLAPSLSCPSLAPQARAQQAPQLIEEVLVTGSRIRKPNLISFSPFTQVDREALLLSGTTRVEDLLRQLPQVYSGQNSGVSNGSSGTATLDLRNLGAQRTLVLVDGRRLPGGSPFTPGAADINQIPGALIERVEVLTGGASAVYGSDAVAGVVNFHLMDDFDGVRLDGQFSRYTHDNDDFPLMDDLLRQADYARPGGSVSDGDTVNLALMLGRNLDDNRGNVTLYATYREVDAVVQDDRIHSACAVGRDNSGDLSCLGSPTSERALLWDGNVLPADFGLPGYLLMVEGDRLVDWDRRTYNFAPFNYFQRPDERWTTGLLGTFHLNARTTLYGQVMYMDDQTTAQVAPSGSFGATDTLPCGNPLLSEQQFEALCGSYGLDRNDRQIAQVRRRNVEGGPRRDQLQHRSQRILAGLRGTEGTAWNYDLYAQYAKVTMDQRFEEELLLSRIKRALEVSLDPATGEPVCRSVLDGSDPDCVPWNIFREGGVTPEATDYLTEPLGSKGRTDQTVVSAYIIGDLGRYGLRTPLADAGFQLAAGLEYRDENLDFNPGPLFRAGDAAAAGEPIAPLAGGFDVTDIFAELSLPLLQNRPLAHALTVEGGYRHSHYSTDESTDTYKLAASWSPLPGLRFRGSLQVATRLPNIEELFAPQDIGGFALAGGDPCGGPSPARPLSDCARSGVTPAQYGAIPAPLEGQSYRARFGGNPSLQSEDSDTRSLGVLYTPTQFDHLNISLDWYRIEIEGAVSPPDPANTLDNCLDSGQAAFCDRVHRDPLRGDLWRSTGEGFIDGIDRNAGFLRTSGYDLNLDASVDLGRHGSLAVENLLTHVDQWQLQEFTGSPVVNCAGRWGGSCVSVVPRLRNYLRLTWHSPWQVSLSALWRYIDQLDPLETDANKIDAYDYFDLSLLWRVKEDIELRAGVNNLLDETPPLAIGADPPQGNGNTLPGVYDALGQYWFAGFSVNF